MTLGIILLITLLLLPIGAFPNGPDGRGWTRGRGRIYGLTSGVGVLLIVVMVLLLMGRI